MLVYLKENGCKGNQLEAGFSDERKHNSGEMLNPELRPSSEIIEGVNSLRMDMETIVSVVRTFI